MAIQEIEHPESGETAEGTIKTPKPERVVVIGIRLPLSLLGLSGLDESAAERITGRRIGRALEERIPLIREGLATNPEERLKSEGDILVLDIGDLEKEAKEKTRRTKSLS